MGEELERKQGTEVAELSQVERDLIQSQEEEFDAADLVVPILKVGQALTGEVTDGIASAGDFINSLTSTVHGPDIEFVVASYQKGRFKAVEDRAYVAYGKVVPDNWDDPFVGQPFSEHPEAEEVYRRKVNEGEIEWGSGPNISTTYNFTGFVVNDDIPSRLSLMRTQTPSARKWQTLLRINRNRPVWDYVFKLSTERKQKKGTYYVINVQQGRKTEAEERQKAVELAQALQTVNVRTVGEEELAAGDGSAGPTKEPEAEGALAVG